MSYILYKTNGQRLVTVVDGSIDKATTDLTFVGKNYAGYGEILNQDLVKLLENFANNAEPTKPLIGQLWYDTTSKKIKIYDGVRFKGIPNFDSQSGAPRDNSKGDFWYDENVKKLKFYDGSAFVTIGPANAPEFNSVQLVASAVVDTNDLRKNILKFEIDDGTGDIKVPAVVARDNFVPNDADILKLEYNYGIVQQGITLPGATQSTGDSTAAGYYFWGTAGTSLGLVEVENTTYTYHAAAEYLRKVDFNSAINNGLVIPSDFGVRVGFGQGFQFHSDSNNFEGKISGVNATSISINLLYNNALTNTIKFKENTIIPNTAIGMTIGTDALRFDKIYSNNSYTYSSYANTYTGTLLGNVVGNVTGNIRGSLMGAVVTATVVNAGTINADAINGPISGTVSGNIVTSSISATGGLPTSVGQISGAWTVYGAWKLSSGSTMEATYADLAERYAADALYGAGTVLVVGGTEEVTITAFRADTRVAGIVSENPAFKMNSEAGSDVSHPYIALKGRVPCKVVGPVYKGDLLVTSQTAGCAESARIGDDPNAVIGRALEDFEGSMGVIEVKI